MQKVKGLVYFQRIVYWDLYFVRQWQAPRPAPKDLQPVFVDYKKEILEETLKSGIDLSYINNENNDLFNLNVIFDMGQDNDKKLSLAVGYLEYLGTDKYSAEELKKEALCF